MQLQRGAEAKTGGSAGSKKRYGKWCRTVEKGTKSDGRKKWIDDLVVLTRGPDERTTALSTRM